MERVSSYGLNQTMLRSMLQVQARYATTSAQSASGLVSETYGGLGTQATRLVSLESTMARAQAWSDVAQTATDRAEAMSSAITGMTDLLTSLRTTLSAAMSAEGTGSDSDVNGSGQSALEDLASQMNLQQDGRYLFAGSLTDTAPVDTAALAAPASPSTSDTSYYQGDDTVTSVRVSSEQTVSYGITANDPAFEKALRAANIAATMTTSPMDETALTEAYDLATEALDALLAVQGSLAVDTTRLETAKQRADDDITVITERVSDVKSVDVAAVTVVAAQQETQLQASYSAVASITKFSLTNYL